MNKNKIALFAQVSCYLSTAVWMLCGCTSFKPWPKEEIKEAPVPAIVDAESITLPREAMIFRRISPSYYGQNQADYYLLETEVTNDMYSKFLLATGRIKGDFAIYDAHIADLIRESKQSLKQDKWLCYGRTGYLDANSQNKMNRMILWDGQFPRQRSLPVTLVTVHDAEDFCLWLTSEYPELGTFRLPTDTEWFLAAYGKERSYPWGNQWLDGAFRHTHRPPPVVGTNTVEKEEWDYFSETSPEPVKWRPQGRTPEGLYGMWGNVSELVIHPSNVVSVTFMFVGTRWMGGSFKDSNREWDFGGKEWTPFKPRQDYWGFTHGTQTKEQWLGFRVLLDPNDKTHKYQPRAPYNYEASW